MAIDNTQFGNLANLKFWCQKVLPAVYDDSLSYYELLNKVVEYLNNTIDAVNVNSEAIKELAEFLDEANISEMVAEVIEEMKENGELADVINDTIFNELNDKIEYLFDKLTVYRGWEGWIVNTFSDTFLASKVEKFTYSPGDWQVSQYNSDVFILPIKTVLPQPTSTLHIAATTDRGMFVGGTEGYRNYGFQGNLYSYVDNTLNSGEVYVRMIQHGRRPTIPDTCPLAWSQSSGDAIANIAKTYYNAMLNGRQFAYGKNFFYISPDNIVNDNDGKGRIECDTFVGLCLRGIDYEHSPYTVLTPNFQYAYDDMYIDVSNATNWVGGQSYAVDDIVIYDGNYYKCIIANDDNAFSTLNFKQIWTINTTGYFDIINQTLHPSDPYLKRDIRFAPDYSVMGFKQGTVFTDKIFDDDGNFTSLHQAKTGDIACWRRVDGKPIEFGGSKQSPGFDNISHVGVLSIEGGEAYIYHVSDAAHTNGHIVDRIALRNLSDTTYNPPDYFVRARYVDPVI